MRRPEVLTPRLIGSAGSLFHRESFSPAKTRGGRRALDRESPKHHKTFTLFGGAFGAVCLLLTASVASAQTVRLAPTDPAADRLVAEGRRSSGRVRRSRQRSPASSRPVRCPIRAHRSSIRTTGARSRTERRKGRS